MSRPNAPATQPGAWPPPQDGQTAGGPAGVPRTAPPRQPLPQAAPPVQGGYVPPQPHAAAPQQPYAQPYPQQPYPQQQAYPDPYADPALLAHAQSGAGYGYQPDYYYPHPAEQAGHTAHDPAPAAQPSAQQRSYAPRFDPYVPSSQPTRAPTAPAQSAHAAHAQPQYLPQQPAFAAPAQVPPQAPMHAHAPDAGLSRLDIGRGRAEPAAPPPLTLPPALDDWPQPGMAQPSQSHRPAPGLDLGGYHAGAYDAPGHAAAAQPADLQFSEWPREAYAQAGQAAHGQGDYAHGDYGQGGYGHPAYADPAHGGHGAPGDLHMQHANAGYGDAAYAGGGALEAGHAQGDHEEYEDDDEEQEPPKRRGSLLMVAGALTAAVLVGGGLAYGYQKFMGKPVAEIATIKSQSEPAKSKPADAGGKQFSHTDSKVMGRLSEGGSSSAASDDPNAPRKVVTIPVGRDGTLAAPSPAEPPPAPAQVAAAPVSVPGMTIVDGFGGRPPAPTAAPAPARPAAPPPAPPAPVVNVPAPPAPAAAPAKPVVVARAAPAASDAAPEEVIQAPAPAKKAVLPKKKINDAYGSAGAVATAAATSAPAASAPAPSGAGYVAVLASVPATGKSRMDALKQFADMQQKYGSVLSDRTPDVQEANLGAKGTYHRLMAGPPGSREQASSVCSQLKAAGYAGCWVTAY